MDLERMARMGVVALGPDDEKLDQPSGVRNSALVTRRLRELVAEVEGEAAQIKTGGRFTRVGLAAELGLLASNALNEVQRVKAALVQAQGDRDKHRQELTITAMADGDDVAAALLRQELRAELRRRNGDDALATKITVMDAVEAGDKATVAAVLETGGTVFRLIPEADLRALRQAWAAKIAPDKAALLARIERAVDEAERTTAWAEARLRELGQLAADDPLARMAATGTAA